MKVIVKEPGKQPEEREIDGELSTLQRIVGGYIEIVPTGVRNTVLVCNEEGKLLGLKENIVLTSGVFILDTVVGTLFVVGVKGPNFISLTPPQVTEIKAWLDNRSIRG